MEQSQAQRRLVKSPPELWAELSSEDSLGRHLAEFGEIRITRVDPETTIAWEGDRARGTVQISPTGWGTQVTLTATAVAEPAVAEAEVLEAVEAVEAVEPLVAEPEPVVAEAEAVEPVEPVVPVPAPVAMISLREPDPSTQSTMTEPEAAPRGFFARFFRRPVPPGLSPEPFEVDPPLTEAEIPAPPAPAPDPGPPTPGPDPTPPGPGPGLPDPVPTPQPVPDPVPPGPGPDPSPPAIQTPLQPPEAAGCEAGPAALAIDPERTVAILTEVLDDLGAAHHRPFSRG